MLLSALLEHLDVLDVRGDVCRDVGAVTRDTREVSGTAVFVAIKGGRFDGHDAVPNLHGAAAVVVERPVPVPEGVTCVRVADTRRALAWLAAAVHGHPSRALKLIGITGTNGKTTTSTLIEGALAAAGRPAGRIGTTGVVIAGEPRSANLTTPEAPELQSLLAEMRDRGVEAVTLEVSSIGLAQRRVEALSLHLGVFTNLSRDHLDFHGDMETYAAEKARMFRELLRPEGGLPRALLCADSPWWSRMDPPADRWLYGEAGADLRIEGTAATGRGMLLRVATPFGRTTVHSALVGHHNALNLTAALGALLTLGFDRDAAADALGRVELVPGRMERVVGEGPLVLVDYAHTPDALEVALEAARARCRGRLWVVFGCGGERDRGKRPEMGRAAEAADRVVLTSDNPRGEDPAVILADIAAGMAGEPTRVEPDRAAAIRWTVAEAADDDVILLAGKGHETYQEVGGQRRPFDDRQVAAAALEAR